jgi:hypothetical protein
MTTDPFVDHKNKTSTKRTKTITKNQKQQKQSFTMNSLLVLFAIFFLGVFDADAADPSSAPVAAPVPPPPAQTTTSYTPESWWVAHQSPETPMSEQADFIAAYNGFKAGGKAMLAADPNWQLCMNKWVDPSLMIFNYNSMPNSCNSTHTDFIFAKIEELVNSVLVSRGLSLVQWNGGERLRRVLRGTQGARRLRGCPACPSGSYFCASRCPSTSSIVNQGSQVRRDELSTNCLPIRGNSFSVLESYTESIKRNMKNQCEELLKDLSQMGEGALSTSCRSAVGLSSCDAVFELADIAELRRLT